MQPEEKKAKQLEAYHRKMQDPAERARVRELQRRARALRLLDPEYAKKLKTQKSVYAASERGKEKDKESRERHPESERIRKRRWYENGGKEILTKKNRFKRTGWTPEMFAGALVAQEGKCAICKEIMTKPCADHDHALHLPRKILCGHCNALLGQAKENINTLQSAILYLKEFGK